MRTTFLIMITAIATAAATATAGCGDDTTSTTTNESSSSGSSSGASSSSGSGSSSSGAGGGMASDPQVPPAGDAAAVQAWIDEGHYKAWHCEKMPHPASAISPHGLNRICTNDKLSANAGGEYAVDSAGVKELYDAAGAKVVGYAVYRHVTAGTTGATWYWYEKVPLDSPAPHDANGIVADGLGDTGPAMTICVGCHGAAGSDAMHPGHDFVYTQVP